MYASSSDSAAAARRRAPMNKYAATAAAAAARNHSHQALPSSPRSAPRAPASAASGASAARACSSASCEEVTSSRRCFSINSASMRARRCSTVSSPRPAAADPAPEPVGTIAPPPVPTVTSLGATRRRRPPGSATRVGRPPRCRQSLMARSTSRATNIGGKASSSAASGIRSTAPARRSFMLAPKASGLAW